VLRRRSDSLKLWIGQFISQIGSHVTREGLPLAAVLVLGATPLQMGLLNGAGGAAVLAFGLFAGAWVDRLRRRPILMVTDIGRALLLASIPAAALFHRLTMTHLYCVAAAAGLMTVLFDVAYQAYVPSLAEGSLLDINSKLAMGESVAEVAGPGLTGILVQWLTAPIAIAVDAASYLVSAFSLGLIRTPELPPKRHESPHIFREIVAGLRASWGDPILRALLARTAHVSLFGGILGSLYVIFAVGILGISPALFGLIISAGGGMALLGALITRPLVRRIGVGPSLIGAAAISGVVCFSIPFAHGPVSLCALYLLAGQLGDAGWTVYSINELSLRQSVAAPDVLGRVNSATQLLFHGLIPVGGLAGGALAQIIGVRPALFVGCTGFLLSTAWLIFSPIRRLRELPGPARR
jgi:MFS family permease